MKRCKKCGAEKPLIDFYRSSGMRDGHRNDCKVCNLEEKAARYRADPRPAIERARRWQKENAERLNATRRRRRESPEKKRMDRAWYLKRTYDMSIEDYDKLLARQDGVCGVCGRSPRSDISLHVDHDHKTGQIRGLLCFRCNNALGDFDDDGDRLITAATYLGPAPKHPALVERLAALRPQPA